MQIWLFFQLKLFCQTNKLILVSYAALISKKLIENPDVS